MDGKRIVIGLLSLGSVASCITTASAATPREYLPGVVNATLKSRYPTAEILAVLQEKEKGVVVYDVELKASGRNIDAIFDSKGNQLEEAAIISASELPEAVRAAHTRSAHGKWTIESVERVVRGPSSATPRYELRISDGKEYLEVMYAADGKFVKSSKSASKDEQGFEDPEHQEG